MKPDTTIGGARRDFPSTLWTQILSTREKDEELRRRAWEGLANRYWKPLYAYVRAKWAKSNEDAKELTQGFFAWMIENDFPGRADPERGRFRVFVKVSLENYLRMDHRNQRRKKRGGDQPVLLVDGRTEGAGLSDVPDASGATPDEILEKAWKEELLTRAAKLLKEAYVKENKELTFNVFHDYFFGGRDSEPKRQEIAGRYSITLSDLKNHLVDAKRRFREVLSSLVAETVERPEDLREELRTLFGKETK
jgi:RNA polymerase sigma-70 factor (ECF subfamily)